MSNYEYNKKYAQKWEKENIHAVTIKLKNDDYNKLKEYCDNLGVPVATFIRSRISDILE